MGSLAVAFEARKRICFGHHDVRNGRFIHRNGCKWVKILPIRILLPALLLRPILFGSFAAIRFAENKEAPLPARTCDASFKYLETAGPIVMILTHSVVMLFYQLLSHSWVVTLLLTGTALVDIIGYCAIIGDVDAPPIDEDTNDLPIHVRLSEALYKDLDVATTCYQQPFSWTG